jgi:hypothetical protein
MAAGLDGVKQRIDAIMRGYERAAEMVHVNVFAAKVSAGKVYEAWVLCEILTRLRIDEGCSIGLRGPATLSLKSSPGPINRAYSYFEVATGREVLEVWTDVEFLTMSHASRGATWRSRGDFHELDIVAVPEGADRYPAHDQIRIGVECKHTRYRKELLRAILGVRRELSWLVADQPTRFVTWPAAAVPASPPSCLLVYCSDPGIAKYDTPGETFGIAFNHHPLP